MVVSFGALEKMEEKLRTEDDQVTSAPRTRRVSIRTAVWIVLTSLLDIIRDANNTRLTCEDSLLSGHLSRVVWVHTAAASLHNISSEFMIGRNLYLLSEVHETRHFIL